MPLTEYQKEYAHQGLCRLEDADIKPLEDQVLVRLDEERNKRKPSDLLYLPQGHSRVPIRYGVVIKTGPGDRIKSRIIRKATGTDAHETEIAEYTGERWPPDVKIGDRIIFERRPWAQLEMNGSKYAILHSEQHIIAVVEE